LPCFRARWGATASDPRKVIPMADIEPVTPAHATPVIVTLPAETWYGLACQWGPVHVVCRRTSCCSSEPRVCALMAFNRRYPGQPGILTRVDI
jgi:hypothetical protein